MKKWVAATVLFAVTGSLGSQDVWACGDKFLLLGRGVRYQRAYAAIHPASILIVAPPKSVKTAAVRDSRLQSALKLAGHRVDVVPAAKMRDALAGSRYDIVLAERADAVGIPDALPPGGKKPSIISVVQDAADVAADRQRYDAVLKTPQSLPDILRLFDDVMKARIDRARAAAF
jgi:hypothetical protein